MSPNNRSHPKPRPCLLLLALILLLPATLIAQSHQDKLQVSAATCPPFVISDNGHLHGLGIFLWEQIAGEIGIDYELREDPLSEMLNNIAQDKTDRFANVGISCLSITEERERVIDFSHSFYETYTGIAVREQGISETILAFLTNPAVWKAVGFVVAAAAIVGGIFLPSKAGSTPSSTRWRVGEAGYLKR
jgi:polar amino acid transport system substrate-binding protein